MPVPDGLSVLVPECPQHRLMITRYVINARRYQRQSRASPALSLTRASCGTADIGRDSTTAAARLADCWEPEMGANAVSRPQTQHDVVGMSVQVRNFPFDSVRRCQTPETVLEFPDTEEVTGSNPVRPTPFFENLSSAKRAKGSQPPAVLLLNRWSEHPQAAPRASPPRPQPGSRT